MPLPLVPLLYPLFKICMSAILMQILNAFSKSFQFRVPDKANFLPFDKESSEGIELSLLDDETIIWPLYWNRF